MTVKLRYKDPDGDISKLIEVPVTDSGLTFADSSDDFAFAASVAAFGMLLRTYHSPAADGGAAQTVPPGAEPINFTYQAVLETAAASQGMDVSGDRAEFLTLVQRAIELSSARP